MPDKLTLVYAYYDNPTMFARHLKEWRAYSDHAKKAIRFIVVDDGSPTFPAKAVLSAEWLVRAKLDVALFRVIPNIPWNQDGARNLAMKEVRTDWAFMTDMDHLLPASQAEAILALDAQPRVYYMPDQHLTNGDSLKRPHPNTYLMRVRDFWEMGGYDEDFAGFYGSDGNFRRCAIGAGLAEKHTTDFHTVVYRTEDIFDANTKGMGRKGSALHVKNNKRLRRKIRSRPYKAVNPIRFEWVRVL